jgi:hypothetical protein
MKLLDIVRLLGLSVISMLIASCLLGAAIGGIWGFVGGPILMLFGWFYLPIVIGLHFIGWVTFTRLSAFRHQKLIFCIAGSTLAAGLFASVGIRQQGSEFYYAASFALAAGISASLSCLMIAHFRNDTKEKHRTRRCTQRLSARVV